jgi:hypothetical protein
VHGRPNTVEVSDPPSRPQLGRFSNRAAQIVREVPGAIPAAENQQRVSHRDLGRPARDRENGHGGISVGLIIKGQRRVASSRNVSSLALKTVPRSTGFACYFPANFR